MMKFRTNSSLILISPKPWILNPEVQDPLQDKLGSPLQGQTPKFSALGLVPETRKKCQEFEAKEFWGE